MSINMRNKQNGAVLIVSLIILLVLTLLAITTAKNSLLQERLSGNKRNATIALQAAESGLRQAEEDIRSGKFSNQVANGHYRLDNSKKDAPILFLHPDQFQAGKVATLLDTNEANSLTPGKATNYTIVSYPGFRDPNSSLRTVNTPMTMPYVIYSKGYGKDKVTQVILSSSYRDR